MVTGAIAYEVLKQDDPAALAKALELIRANPLYERRWKRSAADLDADDRDIYLFMMAARWADDIRGEPEYDKPTWHYIGTGFVAPGEPPTVKLPPVAEPNAVTAIVANAKLAASAPDVVDRSIALTWVCHLVGDIQQPLHACSRVTARLPEGDRGGNLFYIKATPTAGPINLHKFWDDLIIGSENFRECKNTATELRLRPEFAREKLFELYEPSPAEWAAESLRLGRTVAHRNGTLAGGRGELSAIPLPAGYIPVAKALGERRAVVAGYRLAQVLQLSLGRPSPPRIRER